MLALSSLVTGCTKPAPPPVSISQAQQKLEAKCRDDFDMHVVTRQVGNTFYVYLPTDKPLFDYEAQKDQGEAVPEKKNAKYTINFIDGKFEKNDFQFEYDIIDRKKSSKEDYGFNSSYTDSYVKQQNNLFVAVSDTFFDVKETSKEKLPEFFVLIITDIVKGIESRSTFYLTDFKRYMSGDLPYEEYMKRYLAETKGGQSFIGDEIGTHIDYKEVQMSDFLAKQITNRINFKFQRSDFSPSDEYDNDIVAQIADTLRYYNFKAFEHVRLNNLRLNRRYIFEQNQLANFGDDKQDFPDGVVDSKDKGKIVHIIFENGKTRFSDEDTTKSTTSNATTK